MGDLEVTRTGSIATVCLCRGNVNALSEELVRELSETLSDLEHDTSVRAISLTGHGKFFSFGFDVPQLYDYPKEQFLTFLEAFTNLYTEMFIFPKPIVAAINGHAIAGGCMLALACDFRLMLESNATIALNEITFGSSVFAGTVEMLQYCAGTRNTESVLYSGAMYDAGQALDLGLVDRTSSVEHFSLDVNEISEQYADSDPIVYSNMKTLMKGPVVERMRERESASIKAFADIWYSPSTREQLKKIKIRK